MNVNLARWSADKQKNLICRNLCYNFYLDDLNFPVMRFFITISSEMIWNILRPVDWYVLDWLKSVILRVCLVGEKV